MDRKTFIGIAVALGVLLLYPYYLEYFYPKPTGPAPIEAGQTQAAPVTDGIARKPSNGLLGDVVSSVKERAGGILGISKPNKPVPDAPASAEAADAASRAKLVTVDTPLYSATFSSNGASLVSFKLKKYTEGQEAGSPFVDLARGTAADPLLATRLTISGLPETPAFDMSEKDSTLAAGEARTLSFSWASPSGVVVRKLYTLSADGYEIKSKLSVSNGSKAQLSGFVSVPITAYYAKEYQRYHSGPIISFDNDVERVKPDADALTGEGRLGWAGLEDKFFLLALMPDADVKLQWALGFKSKERAKALVSAPVGLNANETFDFDHTVFVGPKEYGVLESNKRGLIEAIEFGYFDFMAKPTLVVLNFFQKYLGNYGLAIIILTCLIKIAFHPLTKHSLKSMKEMQKIQPQMQALREKYKDDKARQNKELMELYKRQKINPMSGCLPMVLQIPVFIALYEVLSVAIELRQAPFLLWITDLSEKDPYYISPLLMGATMFLQQKMTPSTMDPTQQKIMMLMPIFFTFLFLSFPSGLVLYWLVNNVLTIAQQWHIHKAK
jgi:YidC/Oxa1 family membrane protein insertase